MEGFFLNSRPKSPVITILESKFGLGYTLMMIGALLSMCVPLGLLFLPIETKEPERPTTNQQEEKCASSATFKIEAQHTFIEGESYVGF